MKTKQSKAKNQNWKKGMLDSIPMGISFIVFGCIFGVMAIQIGLSPIESVLMSLVSFAGSAQLSVLSMIAENSSISAMVLTTLMINARHLLYGLSLSPYFSKFDWKFNNFIAYFLSDALYALSLNHFRQSTPQKSYIIGAGLFLYMSWGLGTLIGTISSTLLPEQYHLGLEFSMTTIFLILAFTEITSFLKLITFFITGLIVISLYFVLPLGILLLIAGLAAFIVGYVSSGCHLLERRS
ncbi:AzlC family ABC transporter permease [Peribacillus simplex]|nr:AzlC family ABC transporter permease [Peribacillus simplex]